MLSKKDYGNLKDYMHKFPTPPDAGTIAQWALDRDRWLARRARNAREQVQRDYWAFVMQRHRDRMADPLYMGLRLRVELLRWEYSKARIEMTEAYPVWMELPAGFSPKDVAGAEE